MGPTLIVITSPCIGQPLCFGQEGETVDVRALIPERTIEGLDVAIIGRCPRPREVHFGLVMVRSEILNLTGELGVIVGKQCLRGAA
ncbi:MAG: hypothetical protein RJS97_01870 [Parvibaculaceae bacterium]